MTYQLDNPDRKMDNEYTKSYISTYTTLLMKYLEIILVFLLAVYAVFRGIKWKVISKTEKIFIVVASFAAIVIAYNAIVQYRNDQYLDRVNSEFAQISGKKNTKFPTVLVGNSKGGITIGAKNGVVFGGSSPEHEPILQVYTVDEKLYLNIIIRDEKGEVIAAIHENECQIYQRDKYEYNDDDKAFEIVSNGDRRVIFRASYQNGIVSLLGFIVDKLGNGWYFSELGEGGLMCPIVNGQIKTDIPNWGTPLFRYPRKKYHGVRASSS